MLTLLSFFCALVFTGTQGASPPHILLMVADDLGWNDIGYNNIEGQIQTPKMDSFASQGIILNNSYVSPLCTPSRASLLSGLYPFNLGLQHGILSDNLPTGLNLNLTLLPEELQSLGYTTHMIGKWHLGFCNWDYTPTYRGFDSFMGFYSGAEDYYTHKTGTTGRGYDFRLNEDVYYPPDGEYATFTFVDRITDILTSHNKSESPLFMYIPFQSPHYPLTPPSDYIDGSIPNEERRNFSALVSVLDEAFGNITDTLTAEGYNDNLLIIFTSDNGGAIDNGGNNYPLRGTKGTLWEGGTKAAGFVYSPTLLPNAPYTSEALINIVDWMPTLITAAGGTPDPDLDGISQWDSLVNNTAGDRTEMVYGIDEVTNTSAIRFGDYKLVVSEDSRNSGWYEIGNRQQQNGDTSDHLFNIRTDPYERDDIINESTITQDIAVFMKAMIEAYTQDSKFVPFVSISRAPKSNPANYNGTWSPGWC